MATETGTTRTPQEEFELWVRNQIKDAKESIVAKEKDVASLQDRIQACHYWLEMERLRLAALESLLFIPSRPPRQF